MKNAFSISIVFLILLVGAAQVFASTGTIDSTNHYAWNDNGGWVNWYADGGNVSVTDTILTGYIWSANFGWINLAPTNGGVTNSNGTLGGYAWGANTGWVSFLGVTIDSNGIFHGHTVAQNIFGTMTFDCDHCYVVTSWRAGSSGSNSNGSNGGGGGPISGQMSYGYQNGTTSVQMNTATTSNIKIPSTLIPTSKPSKTRQPTTEPPSSSKSSAYTSQPMPPLLPLSTSTARNNSISGASTTQYAPPITASHSCSWFGACWWDAIMSFLSRLFK